MVLMNIQQSEKKASELFSFKGISSHISQVKSATDASNFDEYPPDDEIPVDDLTGWDRDF